MAEQIKHGCDMGETEIINKSHSKITDYINTKLEPQSITADNLENPASDELKRELNQLKKILPKIKKESIKESCEDNIYFKNIMESAIYIDSDGMSRIKEIFLERLIEEIKNTHGFSYDQNGYPIKPQIEEKKYNKIIKEASMYNGLENTLFRYDSLTNKIYLDHKHSLRSTAKQTISTEYDHLSQDFLYLYSNVILNSLDEINQEDISGQTQEEYLELNGITNIPGIIEYLNTSIGKAFGIVFSVSSGKIKIEKKKLEELECHLLKYRDFHKKCST